MRKIARDLLLPLGPADHARTLNEAKAWSRRLSPDELRSQLHSHRATRGGVLFLVQGILVGLSGNMLAGSVGHFIDKMDYPGFAWRDGAWLVSGLFFLALMGATARAAFRRYVQHGEVERTFEEELASRGGAE